MLSFCFVLVTLLFWANGFATTFLFIILAKDWPHIMRKWAEVDEAMAGYGFPNKLYRNLKLVATIVMSAAARK